MPRLNYERLNMRKVSGYAIFINSLQILAALLVALLSIFRGDDIFTGVVEQAALSSMALVVIWGAVLDIRDAFSARRIGDASHMLQEAMDKLTELNGTLRAQRHDFMNHLQVVYSLMEMQDYDDAQGYIEKVYQDIQKVSRSLKTAIPAVNALLASKLAECEDRGVSATLTVDSAWDNMPVPDWELCRVLSNLIDNGLDALKDQPDSKLTILLGETIHDYTFEVQNNGPEVPTTIRDRIFQLGFSTKGEGRGTGLAIVSNIMKSHSGTLSLTSDSNQTRFSGVVPKTTPQANP